MKQNAKPNCCSVHLITNTRQHSLFLFVPCQYSAILCFLYRIVLHAIITILLTNLIFFCFFYFSNETALDARLEVGLEQQAELMLKMMATLQADSILQALTSNSSTGKSLPLKESHCCSGSRRRPLLLFWVPVSQNSNGTDDSLLRALHGGGSPPGSSLLLQPSSIPMLSACFNKLFSMLQVHHVQVHGSVSNC